MLSLFAGQLARVEGVRGLTSGIIPTLLRHIHNRYRSQSKWFSTFTFMRITSVSASGFNRFPGIGSEFQFGKTERKNFDVLKSWEGLEAFSGVLNSF
jgi:hypothetical protein